MPEALFCIIFMFLNVGITAYIIVRHPPAVCILRMCVHNCPSVATGGNGRVRLL